MISQSSILQHLSAYKNKSKQQNQTKPTLPTNQPTDRPNDQSTDQPTEQQQQQQTDYNHLFLNEHIPCGSHLFVQSAFHNIYIRLVEPAMKRI